MESPASTAGPRVYVPISHPDSPVPTYAVLQFLGISPPPDASQTPLLHPQFSPSMPLLSCSSPVSSPSLAAPKRCASSTESSNSSSSDEKEKKLTSIKPSPMKKSASGGGLTSSALSPVGRRNGRVLGPTISITHTDKNTIIHTHSSNFREVVHQLTGATSGDKGLMPVTLPARTTATIRSGAGSDKNFAMPAGAVVVAAAPRIQNGDDNIEGANVQKPTYPTTKLLERRKSNKILERLSTSCRNLPPLVPSPVTPLASDFEKISFPVTPTTSEGSLMPVLSSVINLSPLSQDARAMETLSSSHEIKPPLLRSHSAKTKTMSTDVKGGRNDAMDVQGPRTPHVIHTQSLRLQDGKDVCLCQAPGVPTSSPLCVMDATGPSLALAMGAGESSVPEAMDMQNGCDMMDAESLCDDVGDENSSSPLTGSSLAKDEESVIAKKGFFFHSQRPNHGGPMLLSLFPESPREL